jgi:D-alanine transaminase
MSRVAFVNGQYVPFESASVHVEDRGLQFGDSIYEVFAVRDGRLLDADGHWSRLKRSLGELRQKVPMDVPALAGHVAETVKRNRVRNGLAYLQITRGVTKRDHPFPAADLPQTVIITARRTDRVKAEANAETGIAVVTMPDQRWARCDIKTTALIANVLAKQTAREAGAVEAWLVDGQGQVTEGASTNAWIVTSDGALVTRSLSNAILPGVTRASVLALAEARQLRIVERAFTPEEAKSAAEAFITSAGTFVLPVVKVDGHVIGNGRPGPITVALRADYLGSGR